jgi:hypothetical protein
LPCSCPVLPCSWHALAMVLPCSCPVIALFLPTRHATRHTPHATHHQPHTTRHTPHATRHTPHALRHTLATSGLQRCRWCEQQSNHSTMRCTTRRCIVLLRRHSGNTRDAASWPASMARSTEHTHTNTPPHTHTHTHTQKQKHAHTHTHTLEIFWHEHVNTMAIACQDHVTNLAIPWQ